VKKTKGFYVMEQVTASVFIKRSKRMRGRNREIAKKNSYQNGVFLTCNSVRHIGV
jgi:hypothetical protein